MKSSSKILALALTLALVACVDTTGVSETSMKEPHPQTNANAAVTVVEYADLQCPACQAAHMLIVKPLVEEMGPQFRYEFRNFPLSNIHRYALEAAQAAECAADQGKFWEFVDLVYSDQDNLNSDQLREWAKDLKLDEDLFDRCIRSGLKRDIVIAEYEQGRDLGVNGTPTFFVNGTKIENGEGVLKKAIQEALGGMMQRL